VWGSSCQWQLLGYLMQAYLHNINRKGYDGSILGFGTNMEKFAMCTIKVEGFINIDNNNQPSSEKFTEAEQKSKMANALKNVQLVDDQVDKLKSGKYMVGKYYVTKVSKHF
jgi:hypothetical protein